MKLNLLKNPIHHIHRSFVVSRLQRFRLFIDGKGGSAAAGTGRRLPGGNTAEGVNALHDVNTAVGINNTAVGANALTHETTGL